MDSASGNRGVDRRQSNKMLAEDGVQGPKNPPNKKALIKTKVLRVFNTERCFKRENSKTKGKKIIPQKSRW